MQANPLQHFTLNTFSKIKTGEVYCFLVYVYELIMIDDEQTQTYIFQYDVFNPFSSSTDGEHNTC